MAHEKRAEDDGQAEQINKQTKRVKSRAIRFSSGFQWALRDKHTIRYPAAAEPPPQHYHSCWRSVHSFFFSAQMNVFFPKNSGVYNMYNEHDEMPSTHEFSTATQLGPPPFQLARGGPKFLPSQRAASLKLPHTVPQ